MKIYTRLISLFLSGALLFSLCACGSKDPASPSPSPSSSVSGFAPDPTVTDLTLATTGIAGDFELFTVNGTPVKACFYMYWLASGIAYLESMGYTIDLSSDTTLASYLMKDALDASAQYTIIADKAKELGCEMTQAQIDELNSTISITKVMMGGEEQFNDMLRKIGLDYESFYAINAGAYYFSLLEEKLFAQRPTNDELTAYIKDNDILMAKHILLATVDISTRKPLEDSVIAQKKATAEDILKQLQSSSNLQADFDSLMHKYSEDPGLASNPGGYTFTAGQMVKEFEDATRALEYGQISAVVEAEGTGYHIILRLDPATDELKATYRGNLMDTQITDWAKEANIVLTDEYKNLNVADFYAKFTSYQKLFNEQSTNNAAG